jgi:hypothetical protein
MSDYVHTDPATSEPALTEHDESQSGSLHTVTRQSALKRTRLTQSKVWPIVQPVFSAGVWASSFGAGAARAVPEVASLPW